ncbi:hypothetical protein [Ruegeria faecimaris]|uniref:ABC transporter permease n=1 Tax=Ruegeria faecimaris TaxID=686389 RepID=A0A521CE45_9RHOB|nr:hypothetical protein [Ruegeria faecimaris]SMO57030.1 hypothetical protein SAMN06265380_102320 [Ruegeria faecimaris]
MITLTLHRAFIVLFGFALSIAFLMLGFFASPEAVRTSPPALYNSLLLEKLAQD